MTRGRHFDSREWLCQCARPDCDAPTIPDPALVALCDTLRDAVDAPLGITSGLRCTFWNDHEHGEPQSGHLTGTEVDLACPTSRFRFRLLQAIFSRNVTRVGIGKTFVHVGLSTTPLPQSVVWTYYP